MLGDISVEEENKDELELLAHFEEFEDAQAVETMFDNIEISNQEQLRLTQQLRVLTVETKKKMDALSNLEATLEDSNSKIELLNQDISKLKQNITQTRNTIQLVQKENQQSVQKRKIMIFNIELTWFTISVGILSVIFTILSSTKLLLL